MPRSYKWQLVLHKLAVALPLLVAPFDMGGLAPMSKEVGRSVLWKSI